MAGNSSKIISATATPLASIFGSGFLVVVPLLAGAVGSYAWLAMVAICALAYAMGEVIRHNIRYVEPLLASHNAPLLIRVFERLSDFSLIIAYIISICLYLRVLSSFLFGGFGLDNDVYEQLITTIIVSVIAIISIAKGLHMLEWLEEWALWITLLMITLLFAGFVYYDYQTLVHFEIQWPELAERHWWHILTILGGTLIVVQGFETSRYLGRAYDADMRIKTCRLAQIIATIIYITLVILTLPLIYLIPTEAISENALLVIAASVFKLLPIPLVIAAIFSQFSAAVADTVAGVGDIQYFTKGKVDEKVAYLFICISVIILIWSASTLEIIAFASRAFALYYLIQCLVAFTISQNTAKSLMFSLLIIILAFIAIFAVPVG